MISLQTAQGAPQRERGLAQKGRHSSSRAAEAALALLCRCRWCQQLSQEEPCSQRSCWSLAPRSVTASSALVQSQVSAPAPQQCWAGLGVAAGAPGAVQDIRGDLYNHSVYVFLFCIWTCYLFSTRFNIEFFKDCRFLKILWKCKAK